MLHMIVEQTGKYPMRMIYHAESNSLEAGDKASLLFQRGFFMPYGWIKESGTPPEPHHDCMLMTDREYELGDEVAVKVIGVFMRTDLDHKYVVVEETREIEDISELTAAEKEAMQKLYPRIRDGEGWFGKEQAAYCMAHHEKAL